MTRIPSAESRWFIRVICEAREPSCALCVLCDELYCPISQM
ncbi:MAG: hypothetical protein NZT92_02260 [Abditibacteriales bacterium]|nr:hypothetical protein [Abditibacteriales bacterium]